MRAFKDIDFNAVWQETMGWNAVDKNITATECTDYQLLPLLMWRNGMLADVEF